MSPKRDPAPPRTPADDDARVRCPWSGGEALMRAYHDEEWGVPVHDDRHWYEKIVLDGAQAGLSWSTILRKREAYRRAFANFDVRRVARYDAEDEARLLADAGIVRNRLKIKSAIGNARAFMAVQKQHGSFDAFIWARVGGVPLQPKRRSAADVPARTELSDALSRELRALGFSFVGSTIVYAFMQAAGLVNDHLITCFRWRPVSRLR